MSSGYLALGGETHSANLGDAVIHKTLRHVLHRVAPHLDIRPIDISGRLNGSRAEEAKRRKLAVLRFIQRRLPPLHPLANLLRWIFLTRPRARQQWEAALRDAFALVIGGGSLLADNQLDFPLKVHGLVRIAQQMGVPLHFSTVGVGPRWSPLAAALLRRSLAVADTVTVRDSLSARRLARAAPGVKAVVTFDPAIWTADAYRIPPDYPRREVVGLGVINHYDVNAHRDNRPPFSESELINVWLAIIDLLHQRDVVFELFTNGNLSDHSFAQLLQAAVQEELSIPCPLAPRPVEDEVLVRAIGRYRAVIACRLHANLIAMALRVPAIGLVWDQKVRAYYADSGRENLCLDLFDLDPHAALDALSNAQEAGVRQEELDPLKSRALHSAQLIADNLA